jgi:anti-sigma regulatory factor (Ser/Thr protein kinase)
VGTAGFRHEALLYAGDAEFVARLTPFLREGVERREPVLVVVPGHKVDWLRDALGRDARRVTFADMADVGRNPARIIPVWRKFLASLPPGMSARGVGEPAHAARNADELVECRRHETLLNLAFDGSGDWSLVCPYDTTALPPEVVTAARGTHPWVDGAGSGMYGGTALPDDPLPPPPVGAFEMRFTAGPLEIVHAFVRTHAEAAGLSNPRVDDLDIAVHELAINTLRHAGGAGTVLFWTDGGYVHCEVRDEGVIRDPLAGRWDPTTEQENGRGLWMVNQLCDLVEVRSTRAGTVVRVRMSLEPVPVQETYARRLR